MRAPAWVTNDRSRPTLRSFEMFEGVHRSIFSRASASVKTVKGFVQEQ